jgi:hypothetical protein
MNLTQRPADSPAELPAVPGHAPQAFKGDATELAPTDRPGSPGAIAQTDNRDRFKDLQQQSKVLNYEFDASPEQLEKFIAQVREKSDSFSAPQMGPADSVSTPANSFVGVNAYSDPTTVSGGTLVVRPGAEQQANAAATAQPQAAPAPIADRQSIMPAGGAAKQRVRFVLNVVDRLPPAAVSAPTKH